jgi:hypothetical protein
VILVSSKPREAAALVFGFWLALTFVGPLGNPRADAVESQDSKPRYAPLEARMHLAINGTRRKHNLVDLRREPQLDAIARAHSADMAARRYLSHDTPEGLNPVDRLERAGTARRSSTRGWHLRSIATTCSPPPSTPPASASHAPSTAPTTTARSS